MSAEMPVKPAEAPTLRAPSVWRQLVGKFIHCLRDERGATFAEYLIITAVTVPLVFYLFHPDNGLYKTARDQYELTTLLLMFPGP